MTTQQTIPETGAPHAAGHSTQWIRRALPKTVRADDGVPLYYELIEAHEGAPTVVLANGLGGRLYTWEPLVERLAGRYRIITWDYRGLYESGSCARKDLAIWTHAADVCTILDAEGVESATLVGWSMGVQVALETAARHSDRVERLVLINGTHGHALETAFQPLVRLPWLARYLHEAIEMLGSRGAIIELVRSIALSRPNMEVGRLYAKLRGNPRIADMYRQYVSDIFGGSIGNFLKLFQELDAHSNYHHLPEILHPSLVVSGGLDPLTPAYQSFEIARRLKGVEHLHLPLGTHFVLLEYPELVAGRVEAFLGRGAPHRTRP